MSLKDQRDAILQLLTLAVDECIRLEAEHPSFQNVPASRFEADLTVGFKFTPYTIRSRPALDFEQDIQAQLDNKARVVSG